MIEKLLNQIKAQAQMALSNIAFTRMGTIQGYDPVNYSVKVSVEPVDPENPATSLTGYIPLLSPWVGNGWGLFAAPLIGTACCVLFSEGSFAAPMAAMMCFNQSYRPLSVPEAEFWVVHSSGSSLKFTSDGNVTLNSNIQVNIDAPSVKIGDISAGNLRDLLTSAAADVYNSHTHPANGSPPTQQITSTDMTTHTEAN